eukprot:2182413-Amphidinium_carterae.1
MALQAASLLLTRPWLASLPLIDEGAATSLQEGMFTEVAILAVRWPGPALGPIANCIIAVPVPATEGLAESFETSAAFLKDFLESSPAEAVVLTFGESGSAGIPLVPTIFKLLDLPADFSTGTMATVVFDVAHGDDEKQLYL